MIKINLANKPKGLKIADNLLHKTHLECHEATLDLLNNGRLIVNINQMGEVTNKNHIFLSNLAGKLDINLGGESNKIVFAEGSYGVYNLVLWGNCTVEIGKKTSSNGTTIIADNSSVKVGDDCMFSSSITLQSSDQHGIVDLVTKKIINNYHRSIDIGDHVWLGRNSFVSPDSQIEEGSIVGACSVVVSERIPKYSVVGGYPAKIIRENATWSRSMHTFDDYSANLLDFPISTPSISPPIAKTSQKKILIFANCHGEIYQKAIQKADVNEHLEVTHILSYENLGNFEKLRDYFSNCDVLVIQPVKAYENFKLENLQKILKPECQIIRIPFVRFDGLWEKQDTRGLTKFDSSAVMFFPNLMNSSQVDDYLLGKHLTKKDILNNFDKSLVELKALEKEGDLNFVDFIIENFSKVPLFRDSYHPTKLLYDYLASQIVQKITLSQVDLVDAYDSSDIFLPFETEFGHFKPINDHVARVLGLQYSLDTYWKYSREKYLKTVLDYENGSESEKIANLSQFKRLLDK